MAKIPTADDMTYNAPQVAMKSGSYTPRLMASPLSGLDKAGAELMAKAEAEREDRNRAEYLHAKTELEKAKLAINDELEQNPADYLNREKNGVNKLNPVFQKLQSTISDPKYARAFQDEGSLDVEQFRFRQRDTARTAGFQAGLAKNDESIEFWKGIYSKTTDPAEKQKAMENINHLLGARGGFGENPQVTTNRRQAETKGLIADDISIMDADGLKKLEDRFKPVHGAKAPSADYVAQLDKTEGFTKNPNSTANGRYQFLDGTWVEQVKKHRPDVAAGKSDAEILALKKNDDAFKDEIFKGFTDDNRMYLYKRLGRMPSNGELYLAHQQGAGGAWDLLSDPNAKAVDKVGLDAVLLNGGTKDMTAGAFAQKWVGKFSGTEFSDAQSYQRGNDRFDLLSPAELQGAIVTRRSALEREDTQAKKAAALENSNFELAIAGTEKTDDFTNLVNEIDNSAVITPIQKNDLKIKILAKGKEEREKNLSVARGTVFLSGDAYLNPQDKDSVKDANNAYAELTKSPEFSQLPPQKKNSILADMIGKTRFVPDLVKGNIQSASRSIRPEEVTNAADFVDRLIATNPHMSEEIASEKDLARIRMVNERINAGIRPQDAIEQVDKALAPVNASTMAAVKEELKALNEKKDGSYWRGKAVANFESWLSFDPETSGAGVADSLDGMAAKYRTAFEDNYMITRDVKLAEKRANEIVQGQYGMSDINGFNQVIQFPPEKYYAIEGQDNEWMRDQMVAAAREVYKDTVQVVTDDELRDNLRLIVDPKLTPRTASAGAPVYRLMIVRNGELVDFNQGRAFKFDVDAQKKKMVEDAKALKEKRESTPVRW